MITLQHTLVTLFALRGNEKKLEKEIPFLLIPDAIRKYTGPRQYTHFEQSEDGKDVSWYTFPTDIKNLTKQSAEAQDKHLVDGIRPCALGETTDIEAFEKHNQHLSARYYAGVKKHLVQDVIFDKFIREKIDCSHKYEGAFIFETQKRQGKSKIKVLDADNVRKLITSLENQGTYILAYMLYQAYGITANQEWFDKHVKPAIYSAYPLELAENTYKYMKIPEDIDYKISHNDWSTIGMGDIATKDYYDMYQEVVQQMPQIDYDKETKLIEERKARREKAREPFLKQK